MRHTPFTHLLVFAGISALIVMTAVASMVITYRRLLRRQGIIDNRPLRERLRAVFRLPRQFNIFWLFAVTTVAAVAFAVIRLPIPWHEKGLPLLALGTCVGCWRKRNYLHPIQGSITYAAR